MQRDNSARCDMGVLLSPSADLSKYPINDRFVCACQVTQRSAQRLRMVVASRAPREPNKRARGCVSINLQIHLEARAYYRITDRRTGREHPARALVSTVLIKRIFAADRFGLSYIYQTRDMACPETASSSKAREKIRRSARLLAASTRAR